MKAPTNKKVNKMERATLRARQELLNGMKSEWEKRTGEPSPEGWTLKDFGRVIKMAWQANESEKAFSKVVDKARGISQSEIKKADHDPDGVFFCGIGAASNRDLKIEWVKNRLQKAIEQNDLTFFIRLGDALKRKPRQIELDKVAVALSIFWDSPMQNREKSFYIPPLSGFTDNALLEYLIILNGNEKLTFDKVRKTRQRLGLETKTIIIKGVKRVQNGLFKLIWVDKAKK